MKALRLWIVLGSVAVVGALPAGADTIPFRDVWEGPIYMHIHDYSQATTYAFDTDPLSPTFGRPLLADGGVGNFNTRYTPDQLVPVVGNGLNAGEMGWSVLQIDVIYKAQQVGPNTISPIDVAHPLFKTGDGGLEIVGTLFGRTDLLVTFALNPIPGGVPTLELEFASDRLSIYAQPAGMFDQGAAGSGGRLQSGGVYLDLYASIGVDAAGNPIPGAQLVLTGHSEVGYYGSLAATEGRASFTPAGASGSGDTDEYFSVDGGSMQSAWDSDVFTPNKVLGGPWPRADLRVHATTSPNTPRGTFDWLVESSDPGSAYFVPEPATLALLALGGLVLVGRRKRR